MPRALGPDRLRTRGRAIAAALLLALAGLLLFAGPSFADALTPESGGSPNADEIDSLFKLVLYIAAVVFVVVEGCLIYSLFRYRWRKGAVAAQIHGNTPLEIGWTVAAALILVVLSVVTFLKLDDIRDPQPSGADGLELAGGVLVADAKRRLPPDGKSLNIRVTGRQYIWRYQYPRSEGSIFAYEEMVVPVNTTVTLDIQATDVAHSWWIPKLGGKMDAIPGYTNHTWFKASQPGVYEGQCAELCGRNHANMTARVRVLPVAEYEAWADRTEADIKQANTEVREQRERYAPSEGSAGGAEGRGTESQEGAPVQDETEEPTG